MLVEDFRVSSRSTKSSKRIFDISTYSTPELASELHTRLLKIFQSASNSQILPFERFMEQLAKSGRIRRYYTQNIDCRTTSEKLPSLSQSTIWLHGRLDRMICHKYTQHIVKVTKETFIDQIASPCPICQDENLKRRSEGKRSRGYGRLRPKVLLYGEYCPDEDNITKSFRSDLRSSIDTVLIVGTRLEIPSLRDFTLRLCKNVRPQGLVAWINTEKPKLGLEFQSLINALFIGDCDDLASFLMSKQDR